MRKLLLVAVLLTAALNPTPAPAQCLGSALDSCNNAFSGANGWFDTLFRPWCTQFQFVVCALVD